MGSLGVTGFAIAVHPFGLLLDPAAIAVVLAVTIVPGSLSAVVVQEPAGLVPLAPGAVVAITVPTLTLLPKVVVLGRAVPIPRRALLFSFGTQFFAKTLAIASIIGAEALAGLPRYVCPSTAFRIVPSLGKATPEIAEVSGSGFSLFIFATTKPSTEAFKSLESLRTVSSVVIKSRGSEVGLAGRLVIEFTREGSSRGRRKRHLGRAKDDIFGNYNR